MVDMIPPQTVLTPADAANQLGAHGLDALGLAVPVLSTGWSSVAPGALDDAQLRVTLTRPRAPFQGILHFETTPTIWSTPAGSPVAGPVAVLSLHPEAGRRLGVLIATRLGTPQIRPVPLAMLVHGATVPAAPQPIDWYRAGEYLGQDGDHQITFHDRRGLPIDPVAVASLFGDLIGWQGALAFGDPAMPAVGDPSGLTALANLSGGKTLRAHVIDPHGFAYAGTRPAAILRQLDTNGAAVGTPTANGLVDLAASEGLGRATTDAAADAAANAPLVWGWSHNATLGRTTLTPPPLPAAVNLPRQFFRVTAVDLEWHLLGNRTPNQLAGILGDDDAIPDFVLPQVRQQVPGFDYLIDAMDALGAAGQAVGAFPAAPADALALLVSPAIDRTLPLPPAPGAAGHWPAFPPPNPGTILSAKVDPAAGAHLAFRDPADGPGADRDVVLTIAADAVPPGSHLRAYPRRFSVIAGIGEEPSFVRADGGSAIAQVGVAAALLLVNPWGLAATEPLPTPPRLGIDIVATGRDGTRRMRSGISFTASGTSSFVPNGPQFGGVALTASPAIAAMLTAFGTTGVSPVSLFAVPAPPPSAGAAPASIVDLVRRLATETTSPRIGPHLPTQGRFETIFALGSGPGGATLGWQVVLTGARWTTESRSAAPQLADPGNPAGPDVHATGVAVSGQLGYDLALHALKRSQAVIPLAANAPGWIVMTGGNNWTAPAPDTAGTVAGVMLETIAPFVDSPEASFLPIPTPSDSVSAAVGALATRLGVTPPTITIANEARLRQELAREIATARSGQRDALWSLVRAIGQAREYIYIESPTFSRTAYGANPATPDLVALLAARLTSNPRLKVMMCLPRLPDFDPAKKNWMRAALALRKEAIESLTTSHRARVAAFHPIGFPGRPTAIRSTTVLVDDVYALVGTSHFRRRGMTFDGGVDVASIDRAMDDRGVSTAIGRFRQELLATRLGVAIPANPNGSTAMWTRLAEPEGAFGVLRDLLAAGGQGHCTPVWAGPTDTTVIPQSTDLADPNGVDPTGDTLLGLFGALLLEA